jgi:hypothetical protein
MDQRGYCFGDYEPEKYQAAIWLRNNLTKIICLLVYYNKSIHLDGRPIGTAGQLISLIQIFQVSLPK